MELKPGPIDCNHVIQTLERQLSQAPQLGPVIYALPLYVNDTAGVTKEHYLLLHEKADPAQTATEFCTRHGVPSEACAEVLAKLQRAKKELKPHNKVIFETGIRVKEGSCTNGAPLVLYEGEPPLLRAEMFCALYHPIEGCDAIHRKLQSAHDAHAAAAKVAARFGPGQLGLDWLIAPVSAETFWERHWQEEPLFVQRPAERLRHRHLVSVEDLDPIIRQARRNESDQSILVVKDSFKQTIQVFDQLSSAYLTGHSLVIHTVELFWPPIAVLCHSLWDIFLYPSVNIYLTPPSGAAFPVHTDAQDTFILQIAGEKRWRLFKPPILHPNQEQMLGKIPERPLSLEELGAPFLDLLVRPGDVIYIPRGWPHVATTPPGQMAMHLTLTIPTHAYTWGKVLTAAVDDVLEENPEFRNAFPVADLMWEDSRNLKTEALFNQKLGDVVDRISTQSSVLPPHTHITPYHYPGVPAALVCDSMLISSRGLILVACRLAG